MSRYFDWHKNMIFQRKKLFILYPHYPNKHQGKLHMSRNSSSTHHFSWLKSCYIMWNHQNLQLYHNFIIQKSPCSVTSPMFSTIFHPFWRLKKRSPVGPLSRCGRCAGFVSTCCGASGTASPWPRAWSTSPWSASAGATLGRETWYVITYI